MILLSIVVGWLFCTLVVLVFYWIGRGISVFLDGPHGKDPSAPPNVVVGAIAVLIISVLSLIAYGIGSGILSRLGFK